MDRLPPSPSRRRFGLHAAALALASPWVAAGADAAFVDDQWRDPARQRVLPWRLRLPSTPGPWPLVLFSHGLGGSREGGEVWGQAWAQAGLAVLHLQHPGSDTETLRAGMRSLRAAASAEQLIARVNDVRFVLDELRSLHDAGTGPWPQLQLNAIGLAGHSFGAQTTQAIAGQRFPGQASGMDPRPRAFIAFSPSSPRGGRVPVAESFGAITRPFLAVTGSEDGDPLGSYDSGEPRAQVYEGLPPGKRALLWLDGADHMSFGGNALRRTPQLGPFRRHGPAAERQPAHHALVARITTDWWRAQLLGDGAAREALRQPAGLSERDRWQLG
jgi:predicted dienelactone hydrolase